MVDLLKIAKISAEEKEKEEKLEIKDLEAISFRESGNLEKLPPIISIDGSYCFLFSFLGAETWIVLFRIGVTEYKITCKEGKIHYTLGAEPKVYDHLNVISFSEKVLDVQPKAFSIAANLNKAFSERNPQYFASNIMTYLEDLTLESLSSTKKNSILLKDGALLSFKALEREPIYKNILINCRMNENKLAGISKSNSTHTFQSPLTDNYYLKRYYDKKYTKPTYILVPNTLLGPQTRFDVWGDVHFAKLHRDALKWFRIDIIKDVVNKKEFFSALAAYSMVHHIPGYPIGLLEAHKLAKSVRDFKNSYELELYDELSQLGFQPNEILEGAVDLDGRQLGSFHEIIDQISK